MNNFWSLVGFEYKKVFRRKSMFIFFILAMGIVILLPLLNMNGTSYYHKIGNDMSSLEALNQDRDIILEKKGIIDDNLLKEAVSTAQQAINDKENYFFDQKGYERLKAEASLQYILPYYNIYYFLNDLYTDKFEIKSNEKPISYLKVDDLDNFYESYFNLLVEHIDNNSNLSKHEKNKHIQMVEQIEMPLYNDYYLGYASFKNMFPLVGMIILTLVSIVCSNIFGKEYSDKTVSIILSSKYGKSKVIHAKMFTAMSSSIIICLVLTTVYLLIFLLFHGFTGAGVAFQFIRGFIYSTYPITVLESVLISILVTVFISVAFSFLALLLSTLSANSTVSLAIMFLIVFMPMFIPYAENRMLQQLVYLFPARVFDYDAIFSEYFYSIGSISLTPAVFYIASGAVISLILAPFVYKNFKNYQVG